MGQGYNVVSAPLPGGTMDPSLQPLLDRLDRLSDEFRDLRERIRKAGDVAAPVCDPIFQMHSFLRRSCGTEVRLMQTVSFANLGEGARS
jgi:hypothetical protein